MGRCSSCGGKTRVLETRRGRGTTIRRRRECVECGARGTTYEGQVSAK